MGKSTHFTGQPLFGQITNLLNKGEVMAISRFCGGERYIKTFTSWDHLLVMLYAVIKRFDSLREIMASLLAEANKLGHLGITAMPRRSTLSEANSRRPAVVFEKIYKDLYLRFRGELSADSRRGTQPTWLKRLLIIDSTTISLFSNLIFKGAGRNPKHGKKKGGLKVHSIIRSMEGVPCDVCFTSAATHDVFMLAPDKLSQDDIVAMDRAYIDYDKMQQMSERGITYVTKMKKNLKYNVLQSTYYQSSEGLVPDTCSMLSLPRGSRTAR